MGTKQAMISDPKYTAAKSAVAILFAGALILLPVLAAAQDGASAPKPREDLGFFGNIGRWFDEQAANMNSTFKDASNKIVNFGNEAGNVAKTTVEGAKDAAGTVARIPNARVVIGHEKCKNAPNGAPDCVAAANTVCKAKGFEFGRSVDMTTAEVCPPSTWMSGRTSGSECRTETFVSRVLCQ
jgi:hypothetical protein